MRESGLLAPFERWAILQLPLLYLLVCCNTLLLAAPIDKSFCGLTQYDHFYIKGPAETWDKVQDRIDKYVPRMYRKKFQEDLVQKFNHSARNEPQHRYIRPPPDESWKLARADRIKELATQITPVRIRCLYDASFEAEFEDQHELQLFVRNMILDTQLIYEQPEMYRYMKLQFVVTHLEKMKREWPIEFTAIDMLENLDAFQGPSSGNDYDVTFVLYYRHLRLYENPNLLLGIATLGTFCNENERQHTLLMNSHTVNHALVIAHEFGHSLNILHDANPYPSYFERYCNPDKYLMGPVAGIGKNTWSNCSVNAAAYYLSGDPVFKCARDPARLNNSKPISPLFDFGPKSQGRSPLPGEQIPLSRQCQLGIDKSARHTISLNNISTCDMVHCHIDGFVFDLAPALIGSKCWMDYPNGEGICFNGKCQPL